MLTANRATYVVFSIDDLPPGGFDHTLPFYIFISCSRHRVSSVLLDNGFALNVCPLATTVVLTLDLQSLSHLLRQFEPMCRPAFFTCALTRSVRLDFYW